MRKSVTAPSLVEMKARNEKIVFVTAYDVGAARLADEAGVDAILVGDSLGNVIVGNPTTLGVSLAMMEHHIRCVRNGASRPLIVGDLPFGSYGASVEQGVESGFRLMKAGAGAVKLEGDYPDVVKALVKAGIPTMGHIGFTPQSVHKFGGFRVQGRGEGGAEQIEMALRLQDAGAFSIVLELMPSDLAQQISERLTIPTIGIGAGPGCDGQVQVWHDLLGLDPQPRKHAKRYAEVGTIIRDALTQYVEETRQGTFPTGDQSF
jgi:3-methyl-2-oxobutanoate hydroxymethyltransferase